MAIQLLPIVLIYPMKVGFVWTVLIYSLTTLTNLYVNSSNVSERFLNLVFAIGIARLATDIVPPLFGVAAKWIIVWRYKEGLYPMWGVYHTRWWMTQKIVAICGRGIFDHHSLSVAFYYRLMGAKIGKGVVINRMTNLGDYDLLDIRDGASLDDCTVRPFAGESNTSMVLGKIFIGKNASIGLKSIVAAGAIVPDDVCMGPNSSSHELRDATEVNRSLSKPKIPKCHILPELFAAYPIRMVAVFIASLPWMAGLYGIVSRKLSKQDDLIIAIVHWFASNRRVGFHYLARIMYGVLQPFLLFALVVVIKRCMDAAFGKIQAGNTPKSQGQRLQTAVMNQMLSRGDLISITRLFGTHYEITSMVIRALGAKVGKRIYWHGNGPTMQDFDMIEVGDDVVFGSRSHIITSDGRGTAPVVITGRNIFIKLDLGR